jgi:hypothetical protein
MDESTPKLDLMEIMTMFRKISQVNFRTELNNGRHVRIEHYWTTYICAAWIKDEVLPKIRMGHGWAPTPHAASNLESLGQRQELIHKGYLDIKHSVRSSHEITPPETARAGRHEHYLVVRNQYLNRTVRANFSFKRACTKRKEAPFFPSFPVIGKSQDNR